MPFTHTSNEKLLDQLDEERRKYTKADRQVMEDMIGELVIRGVYPAKPRAPGNTLLGMVHGYGARWIEFRGPLACPHCKADLRSPSGPPFKREIGIYDEGRDYTTHFECPDCRQPL